MLSALYSRQIDIGGGLSVYVPTVGEIVDNEDIYFDCVYSIIASPYDMMVQLDDVGIDFTKINEFDLFCLLFPHLKEIDTKLVFGELDIHAFQIVENRQSGDIVIRNAESGVTIDRAAHQRIAACLRKMLNIPKVNKRPGNEEARKYMLDRARAKQRRQSRNKSRREYSQLESHIIALVNTEQFPYDYNSVRDITIFQFYSSLKQIIHKIQYDNVMIGYYAGTVKIEDLKMQDRTWLQTEPST